MASETYFCAACMERPAPGGEKELRKHDLTPEHWENLYTLLKSRAISEVVALRTFEQKFGLHPYEFI